MAEPSSHIHYSFEDIQRYLQGKMTAAEMHAVEKAALQDPFLADAIEGFDLADPATAQQHLNEINASLIKEKKASKIVAFNKRAQWLSIAALIIVVAGIAVAASYFLRSSDKQNTVAQVKQESPAKETEKDSLINNTNVLKQQADTTAFIAENKMPKKPALSKTKKTITAEKETSPQHYAEDDKNANAD